MKICRAGSACLCSVRESFDCPECVEEDEIPHGAAVFLNDEVRQYIDGTAHVPGIVEKPETIEEMVFRRVFFDEIIRQCEKRNFKSLNPFNILIMGYGGGVLNRATRAAMMAVEAIKNKTP